MDRKFIEEDGFIIGVEGEKTIKYNSHPFRLGSSEIYVLITLEDNKYFNVYVIDDRFKIEPMNCLKEQIPATVEDEYFNNMRLEMIAIEHYLWSKYGNPDKDTVLSFSVEVYD